MTESEAGKLAAIQKILEKGGPDLDVRRAIKEIVIPPPFTDKDGIVEFLKNLPEYPASHLHLYTIDKSGFYCGNCNYEFVCRQDIVLAVELKEVAGGPSTTTRFCFGRDKNCGAYKFIRGMVWLAQAFPTQVDR